MPMFSRFKSKGGHSASKDQLHSNIPNGGLAAPPKPRYQSTWSSKTVVPEEVEELIHACTAEMKTRAEALNSPFLLLPFRPNTDMGPARAFIRNYFKSNSEGLTQYQGEDLRRELRLTEPVVLCSILKWCWARIPNGVVSWPVYEAFRIGEKESNMARNAFDTFIPIGANSIARQKIIVDFFDLLASVAAHAKSNGLGGRKISRLAGWWAFEHVEDGKGFEGGYKTWSSAADACSHLFFAYLRSLSPDLDPSQNVIERIPRSLQALLGSTEYPPETPTLMQRSTPRVVMHVDNVSPTPFALLRRAKHFEYRENDKVLKKYSEFENPLDALTEECKRVLHSVSSTNSKEAISGHENMAKSDESWSTFQNLGFSDMDIPDPASSTPSTASPKAGGLQSTPQSRHADMGRPTTPSWADFTSSGFGDDEKTTPFRLPSDKVLPPINNRATSSSAAASKEQTLAPGELAAINNIDLDDAFWWVWMTSLAAEEPSQRKSVFGRCALVETKISNGQWLIMEEQVKGATDDMGDATVVEPKKSGIFGFSKRSRHGSKNKGKPMAPPPPPPVQSTLTTSPSKVSLGADQQTKIRAAAAALTRQQSIRTQGSNVNREGSTASKPRHVHTPSTQVNKAMLTDASPAMKWASAYDRDAVHSQYSDVSDRTGTEAGSETLSKQVSATTQNTNPARPASSVTQERDLPSVPTETAQVERDSGVPATIPESPPKDLPQAAPVAPVLAMPSKTEDTVLQGVPADTVEPTPAPVEPVIDEKPSTPPPQQAPVIRSPPTSPLERRPLPSAEHPAFRQKTPPTEDDVPFVGPGTPVVVRQPVPSAPTVTSPKSPAGAPYVPRGQQSKPNPAAVAAQRAMQSAQEKEAKPKKPSGLKKLFGRSKDSNRMSMDVNQTRKEQASSSDGNLGRRVSLIRKKQPGTVTPRSSKSAIIHPTPVEYTPEPVPDVVISSPGQTQRQTQRPQRRLSPEEREELHAKHEFSRFDQGPMEDMPAMVPQDTDSEFAPTPVNETADHPAEFQTQAAARMAPPDAERVDVVPSAEPMASHELDHQAEQTDHIVHHEQPETIPEGTEEPQEHEQIQDRWATIRENAAKRAAGQRVSEENQSTMSRQSQSRQSQGAKTDDGETSGEETIESRVARIKARVAELTGGMDPPTRRE